MVAVGDDTKLSSDGHQQMFFVGLIPRILCLLAFVTALLGAVEIVGTSNMVTNGSPVSSSVSSSTKQEFSSSRTNFAVQQETATPTSIDIKGNSNNNNNNNSIRGGNNQLQAEELKSEEKEQEDHPKVAIFMTTHLSEQHIEYLEKCWPAALEKLPLIQNADLLVYTSSTEHDDLFHRVGFKTVKIFRYDNGAGKQLGAIRAMIDPFKSQNRWFDGYDWIIRLNPDVMIRRDDWLLRTMKNPNYGGIFKKAWKRRTYHSDFYAFRPTEVNVTGLVDKFMVENNAETHLFWI